MDNFSVKLLSSARPHQRLEEIGPFSQTEETSQSPTRGEKRSSEGDSPQAKKRRN